MKRNFLDPEVLGQEPFVQQAGVRLDHRYSVDLSYSGGRLLLEWRPNVPFEKRLVQLMPAYLKARNEFLIGVSRQIGGVIVVANPDGTISAITEEGVL